MEVSRGSSSSSSSTVMVTVLGDEKLDASNVMLAGSAEASVLSVGSLIVEGNRRGGLGEQIYRVGRGPAFGDSSGWWGRH